MAENISFGYSCQELVDPYQSGLTAARSALEQVGTAPPSFALIISSQEDKSVEMIRGIREVLGPCPMVGAVSTRIPLNISPLAPPAGRFDPAGNPSPGSIQVVLMASPYLQAKVGVGRVPRGDWEWGIDEAFRNSYIKGSSLISERSPERDNLIDWYLYRRPSLALAVMVSRPQESQARERMVASFLYNKFHGRVPLLTYSLSPEGGLPTIFADSLMVRQGLVMVIFKTDLQLTIEQFHNFEPVGAKLLATRTEGNTVFEFNHQTAMNAVVATAGVTPPVEGENRIEWFSRHPLSRRGRDGRYHLILPEMIGPDGSITLPQEADADAPLYAMAPIGRSARLAPGTGCLEDDSGSGEELAFSLCLKNGDLVDDCGPSPSPEQDESSSRRAFEFTGGGRLRTYMIDTDHESDVCHVRVLFKKSLDPISVMAAENGRLLGEVFRLRDLSQKVFDGIGYGIALMDAQGRILHSNHTYRAIAGESGVAGEQCPWMDNPGSPCRACTVRQVLSSGVFASEEVEILLPGGDIRWLRIDVFPVVDEAGAVDSVIEVIRDFSQIKKLQLSLLNEKSKLEAVVNGFAEILYIVDSDLNLQFIHSGGKPLPSGADTKHAQAKCYQAIFDRANPCPWCKVEDVFSRGDVIRRQARVAGTGDKDRYYQITFSPMLQEKQAAAAVCLLVDITTEKQLEEELIKAEKLHSLSVLSAGMAHELNNPLGAINFNIEVLKNRLKTPETLDIFEAISKDVVRINKIVTNLLSFSRRGSRDYAVINLVDVVNSSLELSGVMLAHSGVSVRSQFDPELPLVFGNFQDIQQVFINLISNAVAAMVSGGEISIQLIPLSGAESFRSLPSSMFRPPHSGEGFGVEVIFSDNGSGIQWEDQNRIFDPFFTTKPENQGTGLGLSVVHKILENHGAAIKVRSSAGHGSTFTILFPPLPVGFFDVKAHIIDGKGKP